MSNKFNQAGTDIERTYYISPRVDSAFTALYSVDLLTVSDVNNFISDSIERNCQDLSVISLYVINSVQLYKMIECWKNLYYHKTLSYTPSLLADDDRNYPDSLGEYLESNIDPNATHSLYAYTGDSEYRDVSYANVYESTRVAYCGYECILTQLNFNSVILQTITTGDFFELCSDNYCNIKFNALAVFG
jgi:hypothetical protein